MEFAAFHFLTSASHSYVCCCDLLPGGTLGQCDPNSHLITISPRGCGQQFLDTMVHEFLHAELPYWRHPKINQISGVLSVHLHALGYRIEGDRLMPDADRMGRVIADMLNQVARDLEGPQVRGIAAAMANYLISAGYRRLRRGANGKRNPDSEPREPRRRKSRTGAGGGGRSKRGKRIGFTPQEGTSPTAASRRVDCRRIGGRKRG